MTNKLEMKISAMLENEGVVRNAIASFVSSYNPTLEEIIDLSSKCLKLKGSLYMVHIPSRLQEIMILLNRYGFGMKELYFVYPNPNKESFLILFRAVKNAKMGLKVYSPIYLNQLKTYQNLFE